MEINRVQIGGVHRRTCKWAVVINMLKSYVFFETMKIERSRDVLCFETRGCVRSSTQHRARDRLARRFELRRIHAYSSAYGSRHILIESL